MKDGDRLLEALKEKARKRDQAKRLWLALGGWEYKPDWLYWMDWLKCHRN